MVKGANVPIAVIDSEIDVTHPDLEGVVAERFDAVGAPEKPHPHGTGMAGAIAAHQRLLGIAPGARSLPCTPSPPARPTPRAPLSTSLRASTGR